MHTAISVVTIAIGLFAAGSPTRAARIWGWKNLEQIRPSTRRWYFRAYRGCGVLLCMAGILIEMQSPT